MPESSPSAANRWSKVPIGPLFVGLLACIYALFILVSTEGRQPGVDSHYHFMMAHEIAQGNVFPSMHEALPFTVYSTWDVDHYWGFHVILSPFTMLSDSETGMKLATTTMFCLVLLSLFFYLRARGSQFPWFWALVPLFLTTIAWRYLHLRGAQLLVPLLLLFLATAFHQENDRKRRIGLVLIAYIGMLSYQGAIVLLTAHIAGLASWWVLQHRSFPWKRAWEPLLTAAGLAAGLTLNPYMNASGQTWDFARYHLFTMGVDRDRLYGRVAEFHGFDPTWFTDHLEWFLFAMLVLIAIGWIVRSRLKGKDISREQAVSSGLAVLGILMTAMAARATEYSVIFGVLFLASMAPQVSNDVWKRKLTWLLPLGALLPLWLHAGTTVSALDSRSTLHTHMYSGAKDVLKANGKAPVLNLVEADYNMLLWEYPRVRCVQGLSRYFLIQDTESYNDVQSLKHPQTNAWTRLESLRRFSDKGVKLVANQLTRINGEPTAFAQFAGMIPHILTPVFRSKGLPANARVGILYQIHLQRLVACLDHGRCAADDPLKE
jgi:hypothetical protein